MGRKPHVPDPEGNRSFRRWCAAITATAGIGCLLWMGYYLARVCTLDDLPFLLIYGCAAALGIFAIVATFIHYDRKDQ